MLIVLESTSLKQLLQEANRKQAPAFPAREEFLPATRHSFEYPVVQTEQLLLVWSIYQLSSCDIYCV